MFVTKKIILLLLCISILGCYNTSSYKPTPEQQALVRQMQAKMLANMQGGMAPKPRIEIKADMTAQELQGRKKVIFDSGQPGLFKITKHQLLINNTPFIDREGNIGQIGKSEVSGEFTYIINDGVKKVLKYNRANSHEKSLKIATIVTDVEGVKVVTADGVVFKGTHFTPTADGFLVSRAGTIFKYSVAEEEKVYPVKAGYHVASFQNGDVSATNYVLLEKDKDTSQTGGFMSSLKGLGSTLGMVKDYGYLLVNIENGDLVPVNVSTGGKDVAVMSNCHRKNNFVNECDTMDTVESLYEVNGKPNYGHYYWGVKWLEGQSGPILIYKESSSVKLVELTTKRIYTLFERMLGVNYIDVRQNVEGNVSVFAKLGFGSDEISDVNVFIKESTALPEIVNLSEI
jgi:hypothetical protein